MSKPPPAWMDVLLIIGAWLIALSLAFMVLEKIRRLL